MFHSSSASFQSSQSEDFMPSLLFSFLIASKHRHQHIGQSLDSLLNVCFSTFSLWYGTDGLNHLCQSILKGLSDSIRSRFLFFSVNCVSKFLHYAKAFTSHERHKLCSNSCYELIGFFLWHFLHFRKKNMWYDCLHHSWCSRCGHYLFFHLSWCFTFWHGLL